MSSRDIFYKRNFFIVLQDNPTYSSVADDMSHNDRQTDGQMKWQTLSPYKTLCFTS